MFITCRQKSAMLVSGQEEMKERRLEKEKSPDFCKK
jgi:hypothetical protein